MKEKPDFSKDHLANERTFLAWIRTAVGLMAFGFLIERFTFFVAYFSKKDIPKSPTSAYFGISLIVFAALLVIFSFLNYKKNQKDIENEKYRSEIRLPLVLTIVVLLLAVILGVLLF